MATSRKHWVTLFSLQGNDEVYDFFFASHLQNLGKRLSLKSELNNCLASFQQFSAIKRLFSKKQCRKFETFETFVVVYISKNPYRSPEKNNNFYGPTRGEYSTAIYQSKIASDLPKYCSLNIFMFHLID